jgi:catabolite regulation protein CreA
MRNGTFSSISRQSKIIEGSPANAVSAVPVMPWPK